MIDATARTAARTLAAIGLGVLLVFAIASLSVIRIWTGFRAATPDKLPLIGPTEDSSISLATGHEGLGITTSLATARLLADYLLGKTPPIPIDPYLPSRMRNVPPEASTDAHSQTLTNGVFP